MYAENDGIEPPEYHEKIWRYMDLAKFIRLLQTRSLYFAAADQFDDLFEGTLPQPSSESFVNLLMQKNNCSELTAHQAAEVIKTTVAVNCWQLNEYESYLMWQQYAKNGVVIQSTFDCFHAHFIRPINRHGSAKSNMLTIP